MVDLPYVWLVGTVTLFFCLWKAFDRTPLYWKHYFLVFASLNQIVPQKCKMLFILSQLTLVLNEYWKLKMRKFGCYDKCDGLFICYYLLYDYFCYCHYHIQRPKPAKRCIFFLTRPCVYSKAWNLFFNPVIVHCCQKHNKAQWVTCSCITLLFV